MMDRTPVYDVVIVGAGIVGLATAHEVVCSRPHLKVALVDKEPLPARHQTGHNSGVIHSGIYYRPGSLKALLCHQGAELLTRFCEEEHIPWERCGKVVVATHAGELPRLAELLRRGVANGVPDLRLLSEAELRTIEPHARGLRALHVPSTGIVSFPRVAQALAERFRARGGNLLFKHRVTAMATHSAGIRLETPRGSLEAGVVINCAGLQADRLARLAGLAPACRIVPFRGEYYRIRRERRHLVRHLIYPVPDPRFPFLGVHFTRLVDGSLEAGPNAVLAWSREGYRKRDVNCRDIVETLGFRGFWRLVGRYWRPGVLEMVRSFSKKRFVAALRVLLPELEADDLLPGGAGVRAQAVGTNGALIDDFVIHKERAMVHVLNAPSPAATSSLAIASHIVGAVRDILAGLPRKC
jgi:L-2-hydroxyglutarate oxidase LhgO